MSHEGLEFALVAMKPQTYKRHDSRRARYMLIYARLP